MERRLISSGSSFEERWATAAPSSSATHVYVAGTAPIMPDDADPPRGAVRADAPLPRDRRQRTRRSGRDASTTSCARACSDRRRRTRRRRCARTARRSAIARPACTGIVCGAARPALARRARGRGGASREADLSGVDHRQGQPLRRRAAACSTTRSARATRHARRRGGVHAARRRDVRSRPAHRHGARGRVGTRARAAHQRGADAVGARGLDACLPHARRRRRAAPALRATSARSRASAACASAPRARIRSRSSSGSASRRRTATARMVDRMQYIARRELIFGLHVHVAVDDPEKAIQVVNGLIGPPRRARRALGELAVLARRADRPRLLAPHGLRGAAALGPAAALPELRGLRRGRRPARAHRLHRGLHAHLVGHPPASPPRHDRDPNLRRASRSSRT